MALSCSVTTRDSLSKLGFASPSFCSAFAASTVRASAIQVYLATPCSVALRHSSNKFGSALALSEVEIRVVVAGDVGGEGRTGLRAVRCRTLL